MVTPFEEKTKLQLKFSVLIKNVQMQLLATIKVANMLYNQSFYAIGYKTDLDWKWHINIALTRL